MSILEFNKELEQKNLNYRLIKKTELYYLFLAKKNGKPKLDYPGYYYF